MSLVRSLALVTGLVLGSSAIGCAAPAAEEEGDDVTSDSAAQAIKSNATASLDKPGVLIGTFPATLRGGGAEWRLFGPKEGGDSASLNSVSARMFDEDGKLVVAASFTLREKDGRFVGAGVNTLKGTPWSLEEVEEALVRDAEAALAEADAQAEAAGQGGLATQGFGRHELNCIRASLMAVGIGGGAVLGSSMGLVSAGGLACIPTMGAGCAVAAVGVLTATATLGAFSIDAYLSCTAPR